MRVVMTNSGLFRSILIAWLLFYSSSAKTKNNSICDLTNGFVSFFSQTNILYNQYLNLVTLVNVNLFFVLLCQRQKCESVRA